MCCKCLFNYCHFLNNMFTITAFVSLLDSPGFIADNAQMLNTNNNKAEREDEIIETVPFKEHLPTNTSTSSTSCKRKRTPKNPPAQRQPVVHNADEEEPKKRKVKRNNNNKKPQHALSSFLIKTEN